MEELKSTTAGQLTRLEIGKTVGVVAESGAYIRDTLMGIVYGGEVERYRDHRIAEKSTGEPVVLLAFDHASPTTAARAKKYADMHAALDALSR